MRSSEKKIALIISCFDWYEKRLKFIERYLEEIGYRVLIVTSDFDHFHKKRGGSSYLKKNLQYITVPTYRKNISLRRIWSHYIFVKQVDKIIKKIAPDFVYSLIPPNYLLKVLADGKRKYQYKLVVDVIDLWPESFPHGNRRIFPFYIWKSLRDKNIERADCVVVECELYKQALATNVKYEKMHTLYLTAKSLEEGVIPKQVSCNYNENSKMILGYLGSINSLIDIDKICRIVMKLKVIKDVEVRIIGCGEKSNEFITKLENCGVNVIYYGAVFDEKEKYTILHQCHYGLNIYKENVKIGLTMKSIDYFKYGLPILNTIKGDTEQLVNEYKVGININELNVSQISEEIEHYKCNLDNILMMFNKLFDEATINKRLKFLDEV